MATPLINGDWVIFRIDNSGIKINDKNGNPVTDVKRLGDFNTVLNAMQRRMQSLAGNKTFSFNTGWRRSNPATGYQYQDVAVRKEDYNNFLGVLRGYEATQNMGSYVNPLTNKEIKNTYLANAAPEEAQIITFAKKIAGTKARARMKVEASLAGGIAQEAATTANPERMKASLLVRKSYYDQLEAAYEKGDAQSPTTFLYKSNFESTIQKQRNEKALRRNAAKIEAEQEAKAAALKEEKDRQRKEIADAKLKKRAEVQAEREKKKAEVQAAREKKKAEAQAVREKKKAETQAKREKKQLEITTRRDKSTAKQKRRKGFTIAGKILAVITLLADLVRRVLTAVLSTASQTARQTVEAHSVGISYMQRRDMDIFDTAHGLSKGTTFKAVNSIQSMFGDVTNLDEKALGTLARVMGSSIGELVKSGLGGKNPNELLENILNSYFARFRQSENSLGQKVTQAAARRELITSLSSVSPEIARLLAQMIDDYTSGKYGNAITDYSSWRNTTETNKTGLTPADVQFASEIGTRYNEILAIVDDLKNSFFTRLADSTNGFLSAVKSLRIGESATNNINEDVVNRKKNETNLRTLQKELTSYNNESSYEISKLNDLSETPISRGFLGRLNYSENDVANFKYNAETLAGIDLGLYDKKYFTTHMANTGMTSVKEINKYIQRGRDIIANAMFDPLINDEFFRARVILQRAEKINKENNKPIGSGIKDLTLSEAGETEKAQQEIEKNIPVFRTERALNLGSMFTTAYKNAYTDYFANNPLYVQTRLDELRKNKPDIYRKIISQINDKMTPKEKASVMANYDYQNWFNYAYDTENNPSAVFPKADVRNKYVEKSTTDLYKSLLTNSDSSIISSIIRKEIGDIAPGVYSVQGIPGASGSYTLKIIVESGKNKGTELPSIVLNDQNGKAMSGTLNVSPINDFTFQQSK